MSKRNKVQAKRMRFSMIPDLNIALRIVRWMQKDGLWDMVHDDENWSNVKLKYVEECKKAGKSPCNCTFMKEGLEKYIGGYTKDKDLVEAKYLAVFPQEAPSESSVEETEEEETTKEKIFEGRQFVFINYDENDAAFHLAKGAKALVKEYGGTLKRRIRKGVLEDTAIFPINFGPFNENVKDVLENYQNDVYRPSLIYQSVAKGCFEDPGAHIYYDRILFLVQIGKVVCENLTGHKQNTKPIEQGLTPNGFCHSEDCNLVVKQVEQFAEWRKPNVTKMAFVSTQTEKVVMVDKFTEFYNFLPNYADFIAEKQDTGIQTDSIEEGVPQHLVLPEAQGQPEPLPEEADKLDGLLLQALNCKPWREVVTRDVFEKLSAKLVVMHDLEAEFLKRGQIEEITDDEVFRRTMISDANTRFSPFASKGTQLSKFRIAVINAFGSYSEELKLFFDENFRTWMKENKETKN